MGVTQVFQCNVVNAMADVFISFKGCREYTEESGTVTVRGVPRMLLELNSWAQF